MATADTGADRKDEWIDDDPSGEVDIDTLDDDEPDLDAIDDPQDSDEADDEIEYEATEALDKLEEEELEMLTEDEAAESLPVDEAEELRQIRREAIALEAGAEDLQSDEFVCANCFLVKRTSQLANRRKKLCKDCV